MEPPSQPDLPPSGRADMPSSVLSGEPNRAMAEDGEGG